MRAALLFGGIASAAALVVLSCVPRTEGPQIDPMGPNAGCYICHMTFVREEISRTHLKAKIGCIRCHGPSIAHANDEDVGATPPDVTYRRSRVNTFCRTCHKTHDVAPEQVVARWRERRPRAPATRPSGSDVTCTDCHGTHKIAKRP